MWQWCLASLGPARPAHPWWPGQPTHQETLDELWRLSELIVLGAKFLPEHPCEQDGGREEAGF